MDRICNILKSRKGTAMVIVMGVMSVVMIISTLVISLFTNNLKLAKHQELKTQAYYLALSGVDLGMSSLLKLDAEENRLLDVFRWDPLTNPDMEDDLANKPELTDVLTIGDGTVYLTITPINTGSRREVRIHANAVLNGSGVSNQLTLIVDTENPYLYRWD